MASHPSKGARLASIGLGVLVVVGFCVFVATHAAGRRLAQRGFYEDTLREHRVYDRVYDDLIADPAFAPQLERLLGGVDVRGEDVAATIEQVAKPEHIRALVETVVRGFVGYLRGGALELSLDITPVVERVHGVAVGYAVGAIERTPVVPSASLEAFAAELRVLVERLVGDGALPAAIPSYPLVAEADRQLVARILIEAGSLDATDADHRAAIDALVDAIRKDDVALAIKVSCAAMLAQLVTRAVLELTDNRIVRRDQTPTGLRFLLSPPAGVTDALAAKLRPIQRAGEVAGWARIAGLVVVAGASLAIYLVLRRTPGHALRGVGVPLAVAGAVGTIGWLATRGFVGGQIDAAIASRAALPPSLRAILSDVAGGVVDDLGPTFLVPSAIVLVIGTACVIASIVRTRPNPSA